MNRNLLLSVFWVASLAVVFLLGRALAPNGSADPQTPVEPTTIVEERIVRTVEFVPQDGFDEDDDASISVESTGFDGPAGSDFGGGSAADTSHVTDAQIREMLPSALNSDDRITQNLIVAHMLSQLTACSCTPGRKSTDPPPPSTLGSTKKAAKSATAAPGP